MRILHVLSGRQFHGAESMAAELMRQSHALGVSVELAIIDAPGAPPGAIDQAVAPFAPTHRVDCRGPLDPGVIGQLRRLVSDRGIEVVHSHKYKSSFYASFARTSLPVGLVTTYHNWLGNTRALRFYAAVDKRLARFNDLCVGVSTAVVRELRRYVPSNRVRQIDNGIDLARYSPAIDPGDAKARVGFPADVPVVGFVGRLSAEKGLDTFLDAVARIDTRVHVAIVGDGELAPQLPDWIASRGLAGKVQLLGNRRDTAALYQAFDVFVLPSTTEAFPMVLLEAMASECPVVATAVGEVERIVQRDVTGYVVEPRRADELQSAMQALLGDTALRARFGRAGRERALDTFSSQRMAKAYLSVYDEALRLRQPRSPVADRGS